MATNFMAKFGYQRPQRRSKTDCNRHSDYKIFNGNILATFYVNLMKIGHNPKDLEVLDDTVKWAYLTQYGTYFSKLSVLVDICMGIIKLTFVLQLPKRCCYGNQLTSGAFCRRRNRLPSLFALDFQNGIKCVPK